MSEELTFPKPIKVFLILSIALTLVSLLFALAARKLGYGLPYSFAYFLPVDMFADYTGFSLKMSLYGTPQFFTYRGGYFMYPAPMLFLIRFMRALPLTHHVLPHFFTVAVLLVGLLSYGLDRVFLKCKLSGAGRTLLISTIVLTSYPLVFDLQRANMEIVVFTLSTFGVWMFYKRRPYIAALLLGFAISLKLYPFILLGLFLPVKQYRAFALAWLTAFAILLCSYAAIGPTVLAAFAWNSGDLANFGSFYAGKIGALGYDHSLLSLAKFFFAPKHGTMQAWVRPYNLLAAASCVLLYFARFWRLPIINQILALSLIATLIPPVSYDYTLLNLYVGFILLVILALQGHRRGVAIPHLLTYMILFAIIFTPESFCIWKGAAAGAQVRCLAMLIMLVLSITFKLPDESNLIPLEILA